MLPLKINRKSKMRSFPSSTGLLVSVLFLFVVILHAWSDVPKGVQKTTSSLPSTPTLGVCYYPEQWSSSLWSSDIKRMKQVGIRYVRLGEFMWSVIEPSYQTFNWTVIDRVLDLMKEEGSMRAIIGTPTATPPKWLIDAEGGDNTSSLILPWSIENQVRTFGSRRHYKFSSDVYLKHSRRIVEQIARRYGNHPVVAGFQLDNEYGCHSTVRSYDRGDTLSKFRGWLKRRYGNDVRFLNERWGNSFWSMEYKSFEEIDLPNLTVTEANPSHWLAFYRFSSDLVAEYSDSQTQVLRQYINSDKFITTNFMGMFWDMDHFDLTEKSNLDIASWDSYPLGFTDSFHVFTNEEKIMYAKTGHPDISAFHHDLYSGVTGRGMKRDQFIVMEVSIVDS